MFQPPWSNCLWLREISRLWRMSSNQSASQLQRCLQKNPDSTAPCNNYEFSSLRLTKFLQGWLPLTGSHTGFNPFDHARLPRTLLPPFIKLLTEERVHQDFHLRIASFKCENYDSESVPELIEPSRIVMKKNKILCFVMLYVWKFKQMTVKPM